MTMTNKLPNSVVEAAIRGETKGDHAGTLAKLEAEKAKIQRMLDEQHAFDEKVAHLQAAGIKIRAIIGHDLTNEEREALEGKVIWIHGGLVDVRIAPLDLK